jgi:exonuclease SbcC
VRLCHLRVKNIRSYKSGALDFGAGTTLISGDVGAGKTSLLYAIEMALFGTSEVDAAYLVRHGAAHAEVAVSFEDDEHRYEISRRFRRVRRRGKESFEPEAISFSIDGAKTEYSATELRQRVIELLGFPDNPNPQAHSDLWRWAVYVPQERMRDILSAKPQDRLGTVRKALGVEKYRTAADNAQELATDLRRSAHARRAESELLRHFDDDFAASTQESDRLRAERVALENSIEARGAVVARARSEVEAAEGEVRRAEADRRELESLLREDQADIQGLVERARIRKERLAEVEKRRAEAGIAEGEATELDARRRVLSDLDARRGRHRAELDGLAEDLRRLHESRADLLAAERRIDPTERGLDRLRAEALSARSSAEKALQQGPSREPPAPTPDSLELLDAQLLSARERERDSLTELTRAQASLHEFEELLRGGVCPRCGQTVRSSEFEHHREEAAALERRTEEEHRHAVEDRTRIEEARHSRERYERAREAWLRAEHERTSAAVALRAAEERVVGAETARNESVAAVASARARVEEWAPVESRERTLRAELGSTESEHARARDGVERASVAAERMRAAVSAVGVLEAEVGRIDRETDGLKSRGEERRKRIEELRRHLEGAEEQAQILREATARLRAGEEAAQVDRRAMVRVDTQLDGAVRRASDAEKGRAERARRVTEAVDLETKAAWVSGPFRVAVLTMEQKLLAHAQAAFERNFARYFAALIDDAALIARTDVAFTPAVSIEGEWTPAEALSGGERTSLALAFRLALAQVVRSLGNLRLETILLDEPTDGFSPEQVVRMGELLAELELPQVVIVSHEDELAGIADRVVRVEKIDGASTLRTGSEGTHSSETPLGSDTAPAPDAEAPGARVPP